MGVASKLFENPKTMNDFLNRAKKGNGEIEISHIKNERLEERLDGTVSHYSVLLSMRRGKIRSSDIPLAEGVTKLVEGPEALDQRYTTVAQNLRAQLALIKSADLEYKLDPETEALQKL